jgi:hypothetical protein
MPTPAPTTTQIRALVKTVLQNPKSRRDLPIGIRSPVRWEGSDSFKLDDGRVYELAWCTSPLQVRSVLTARSDERGLVLITPLEDHAIGADVLARLAKGKTRTIEAWDLLKELFQAREIDTAIEQHNWLAEALLGVAGDAGFNAVPTGLLDAGTVWRTLFARVLGLEPYPPDLQTVLAWTQQAENLERYQATNGDLRTGVRKHLTHLCGPAAAAVLDCVEGGHGLDATAIGLACRIVFGPPGSRMPVFPEGAVRLEKYMLDHPLAPEAALHWAAAAEALVRRGLSSDEAAETRLVLGRADQLARDLRGTDHADVSDVLPLGFERRLVALGRRMTEVLRSSDDGVGREAMASVREALRLLERHDQAHVQTDRFRRAEMAVRLLAYLQLPEPATASFEDAAIDYASNGSFVDLARSTLPGEGDAAVAEAYATLSQAVFLRRERENTRFADLLVDWTTAAVPPRSLVLVEDVLARVVAPLASVRPTLLLVLDGMSHAVFQELIEDLLNRQSWVPVTPEDSPPVPAVVATLPCLTEFSRTSLLCGRLSQGGQAESAAGFASHPDLLAASRSRGHPVLFHKAELGAAAGTELAADLRDALASPRHLVGVVINAVDDHLAKGEQVSPRWTVEYIRVLGPLLHAAATAGRAVVLVSDHGHMLDRGDSTMLESDRGERWRSPAGRPADPVHERLVRGSRVLVEQGAMIGLCSEAARYGGRKNGYHGGLTPQEMLIPLAVLAPASAAKTSGWKEVGHSVPGWWELAVADMPDTVDATPVANSSKGRGARGAATATLFDVPPPQPRTRVTQRPAAATSEPAWLDKLLAHPTFKSQQQLAARTSLAEATVRRALTCLSARGTLLRPTLARELDLPPVRLPGVLAALRRLLNLDGVDVLAVNEASDSVTLDLTLLKAQFELGSDRGSTP